jgi:hypothetical protein
MYIIFIIMKCINEVVNKWNKIIKNKVIIIIYVGVHPRAYVYMYIVFMLVTKTRYI